MKQFSKKLAWYPPAETKIPLSAIFSSFLSSDSEFEKTLCSYLKVDKCVLGNSGRTLLYLLLAALKRKDGGIRDEVLIPGYTCYSVAASVARAGLKIKVYDVDPKTLGPDLDSLRAAVSSKTISIISQHLFGIPTPLDGLKEIAQETGACFIEDAAQALGGTINGQPVGTMGDFGETIFDLGFDVSAMPLVMKKLAEKTMAILDELNTHRSNIAKTYEEAFDDERVIPVPEESKPVYTRFPLMAGQGPILKELKRLGVRRMYPKAIADEETIKPCLVDQEISTPGASEIARNLITLPTHNGITEKLAKEIALKLMPAYQLTS